MTSSPRLLYTRGLAGSGGDAEIARRSAAGSLVRVRQGAYADAGEWEAAKPEERMRLRARALAAATVRPPVFASVSAAVEWGCPIWRAEDDEVHVIDPGRAPARSRADVVCHRGALPDADVVEKDGLKVTSLSRTVFDVIRTESLERAVAVCDAAVRIVAWRGPGRYDQAAAQRFRDELQERIVAAPGARGIRQARFVVHFADGRADRPGESVSRVWMHQLGAPAPALQLEIRTARGRAYPDFAWPRLRRFGEFDGEGKYVDPELSGGRPVRDVLRAQRDRENAIVAATGWAPIRWGSERLTSKDTFEKFLRAQHLLGAA